MREEKRHNSWELLYWFGSWIGTRGWRQFHALSSTSSWHGLSWLWIVAAVFVMFPEGARAGGILHLFPPTVGGEPIAVSRPAVLLSKTLVTVSESTVEYRTDQIFFNNNEFSLEGLFILPIDAGTPLISVDVNINGSSTSFSLISANDFLPLLLELTTAMKDPSLLSIAGKDILVVRPVHVGVRKQMSVRVHFARTTRFEKDHLELMVPLDGERFSLGPVSNFELLVRFKMNRTMRTVFSPTHHFSIVWEAEHRCLVSVKSAEKRISDDFRLLVLFSGRDLDLRLFPYRQANRKGSFIAFVLPALLDPTQTQPLNDVVFILDRSGSMNRLNLEQGQKAIVEGLERLRPQDRFNVLSMATFMGRMRSQLVPATDENILEAFRFVNSLSSEGGTDLYNCLLTALDQLASRKRPGFIVVVGQGRSTVGITNPNVIVDHVRRNNRYGARIFALALGDQADTAVLNNIAESTKGSCLHVSSKDDFDSIVSRFYDGISQPQVSDFSLDFQDLTPEEVIPDPNAEVLRQDGLIFFGCYGSKNDVPSKVRIVGKVKGHTKTVTRTVEFPMIDDSKPYIEQVWAMRKMAKLLERQLLKGPESDTQHQISALAKEYGFLSVSSNSHFNQARGTLFWQYKTSAVPSDVQANGFRRINNKLFRFEDGVWLDTEYHPSMEARIIPFMSPVYFDLLKEDPSIGAYLALGPYVIVVLEQGSLEVIAAQP